MLFFLSACHSAPPRFLVYYGKNISAEQVRNIDWAIVDPDQIAIVPLHNHHTKFLAYVSIGEAETYRTYWPKIAHANFLQMPNPDWSGTRRVDLRSHEWQTLLINEVIAPIVARGFDGIMLDTVDTAGFLEDTAGAIYMGSRDAAVQFICALHDQFPQLLIVPNNGLDLLPQLGNCISGVLVEDLYTHHDTATNHDVATLLDITADKERALDAFHAQTHLPVLTLLYSANPTTPLAQSAAARARVKGYGWYITTADLQTLPANP